MDISFVIKYSSKQCSQQLRNILSYSYTVIHVINLFSGLVGGLFYFFFSFGCTKSSLLHAGFPACGGQASHFGGFSHCRARTLECAGFISCGSRLQNTVSVAVAHRLRCPKACGIFLGQGLNPCPLHWQVDSLPLGRWGSLLLVILNNFY